MGFGAGLIFSFLFWHLQVFFLNQWNFVEIKSQDIGGSPVLFGILSVTNHTAEIISYFYTYKIINKFGHVRVGEKLRKSQDFEIFRWCTCAWRRTSFGSWFSRFSTTLGWSFPCKFCRWIFWNSFKINLPFQGVCLATTWATATSYISLISPPQVKSSSQYILQLSYNGLGRGVGSIFGGWIISNVGEYLKIHENPQNRKKIYIYIYI